MTKIRIPADQISDFKAVAKAFSVIIQQDTGVRLRGRTLLNIFALAAGHIDYNGLLYDAQSYGDGKFSWSAASDKLSHGLSVQLGVDHVVILGVLQKAKVRVGIVEFCKADTSDFDLLIGDQAEAIYANVIRPNANNAFLFDTGLCSGDE